MTGASAFQKDYKTIIPVEALARFVERLGEQYTLTGPVGGGLTARFEDVSSFSQMDLDYQSTMLPPGKKYLFEPVQEVLSFDISEGRFLEDHKDPQMRKRALIGLHPCDVNAILYLDKVFLGQYTDPFYRIRRENIFTIALNCKSVTDLCFCHLVGAGPYLKARSGYDILLTELRGLLTDSGVDSGGSGADMDGGEKKFLLELASEKARDLFHALSPDKGKPPEEKDLAKIKEMEAALLKTFKKNLDMEAVQNALLARPDHHALKETADSRCLSCSNCVMVCPTCFCHDVRDETDLALSRVKKIRRWDACQDISFARVHGGNFRAQRYARLRQFVFHKLDYDTQFGMKATVGCGRCIRWCPTGIDLTEIAKAMME
ncbi:MAG: 4Fe-4S dicluster domain-containing protein [Nitrospiraceae bacterium]|nr:4Fe-4S dicluster domain-containing protein [Nitrospiraceae bacterium]